MPDGQFSTDDSDFYVEGVELYESGNDLFPTFVDIDTSGDVGFSEIFFGGTNSLFTGDPATSPILSPGGPYEIDLFYDPSNP